MTKFTNIKSLEKRSTPSNDEFSVVKINNTNSSVNSNLLNRLTKQNDVNIPGLEIDSLLEDAVNNKISEMGVNLDDIMNDSSITDENKKSIKHSIESIKENVRISLKPEIEKSVSEINSSYNDIISSVESMKDMITSFVANITVPKVIVAGTATGVSNPITAASEAKIFKNQIKAECRKLNNQAINLVTNADKINFKIPKTVETTLLSISAIEQLLNKIPF